MLPVFTQTCTEASAAERSGFRINVTPLGNTVRSTDSRQNGAKSFKSAASEEVDFDIKIGDKNLLRSPALASAPTLGARL